MAFTDGFYLGSSTRHLSKTLLQRVWKRQPAGGFIGLGTSPCRMMRVVLVSFSTWGNADSRASV